MKPVAAVAAKGECRPAMFRLESSRLRALRQLAGLGKKAASACESSSVLQSAWGAALGVSAPAPDARRGALAAPRALYHKRNPYDFRVVRDEDDELPGVQNLELSIDEMDEQRKKAERGVDEAKAAALKLLGSRAHSRKEVRDFALTPGFYPSAASTLKWLRGLDR